MLNTTCPLLHETTQSPPGWCLHSYCAARGSGPRASLLIKSALRLLTSHLFPTRRQPKGNSLVLESHICLLAAMQTLCALVSHDDAKQRWLQSTGILGLLQRLTVQDNLVSGAVPLPAHPVLPNFGENTPLRLWRESARIIAMISADAASQTMIRFMPCFTEMHASFAGVTDPHCCCTPQLRMKAVAVTNRERKNKDSLLYYCTCDSNTAFDPSFSAGGDKINMVLNSSQILPLKPLLPSQLTNYLYVYLCLVACRHTAWVPWLQAAATIDDCKLSSHAARALLHLESARCFPSINTYQFEHNLYEPQMLHRYGLLNICIGMYVRGLVSVHNC